MERPGVARFFTALLLTLAGACAGLAPQPTAPTTLRVLTWNIHAGRGTDGILDTERIARVITEARPDLVALQEVDRGTDRADGRDLADEIARITDLQMAFGQNLHFQGGTFGNAILSRWPLRNIRNIHMPVVQNGEQRGALLAHVELPGDEPILFIATHLDHRPPDTERLASVAMIDSILDGWTGMAMLAGDLNAEPESAVLARLGVHWIVADPGGGTFPAGRPDRRIDYIALRRNSGWTVIEARVLSESVASDHRPVLVVLSR